MGLCVLLHWRDVAVASSWACIEGSQPLAGTTKSLGPVKVPSLAVFDSGMNTLKAARLDAPPSIHKSTAQHVARHEVDRSLFAGPENRRYARECIKLPGDPLQVL